MSPGTRTALPHPYHEQTVRQHHEVHMPGLALAAAYLTVSHARMVLAVPMKGLGSRPAFAIHVQNTTDLPVHAIGQ